MVPSALSTLLRPLLLPLLLLGFQLVLSLHQTVVPVRDFPKNDRENHGVHEDDNEVKFEKHHGCWVVIDIPSAGRLWLAAESERLEYVVPYGVLVQLIEIV